jgi:general secretion pathway protein G
MHMPHSKAHLPFRDATGKSGFTAVELVIVLIVFVLAVYVLFTNILESSGRPKVSQARSDLRTLATAIESYHVDTNAYPAWSAQPGENYFIPTSNKKDLAKTANLPTFKRLIPGNPMMTLTTPQAYIAAYLPDIFTSPDNYGRQIYCYWTPPSGEGWIVWSPGPDHQYDLTMNNIAKAYDGATTSPSILLLSLTYDPTNGTISKGDVWRIKQ